MTVLPTTIPPQPYCIPLASYDERFHTIVGGPYSTMNCDNNCIDASQTTIPPTTINPCPFPPCD